VRVGFAVCIAFLSIVAQSVVAQQASWPIAPLPSPMVPIAQDWPLPSEKAYANAMDEVMLTPPCSDQESATKSRQLTRLVDRYVASFESRFGRKPENDPEGDIAFYDSSDCDIELFDTHSRRALKELQTAESQIKSIPFVSAAPVQSVKQ
jgi:hypothetical protein